MQKTNVELIVRTFADNFMIERARQIRQASPDNVVQYVDGQNAIDKGAAKEWILIGKYAFGQVEYDRHAMIELCEKFAELVFTVPGANRYEVPLWWGETDMGELWWTAYVRALSPDLIGIKEAARMLGASLQSVGQRITRGQLASYTDLSDPFRRRLVKRQDVELLLEEQAEKKEAILANGA
jgi:hypothetical protein